MRGVPQSTRLPNWLLGLAILVVVGFGSYFAYTKDLPFIGDRFEVHAVFNSPQTLRTTSPVRIAGVNIGKVTAIELVADPGEGSDDATVSAQPAVRVTMELEESALPLSEDATFKTRPRIFIDGNYFVDVHPGSPSAPKVEDGHTFGLDQTAHSVQLDQVLAILQSDVRSAVQTLLDQFGNALIRYGGAKGLQELYRTSPAAYRYTAQVNEAQLGTQRGDLRGVVKGLGKVLGGLSRNDEALKDLVTNLRTVTGSFAAEDRALARAIEVLPDFLAEGRPTFRELNAALPSLRAFAREALPGVRKSPEALRAGLPLLQELRALVSRAELRGLVARLRPTVPQLARLARGNVRLFTQQRALSSCFNEVFIPWSNSTVEVVDPEGLYPLDIGGRTFELTGYSITGSSSESRSGDANGQHLRVLGGSGTNIVTYPAGAGRDEVFSLVPFPILGAVPRVDDSAKTAYRPDSPCEQQEPPNLEAGIGSPPEQQPAPARGAPDLDLATGAGATRLRELVELADEPARLSELRSGAGGDRVIEQAQRLIDRLGLPEIDLRAAVEGAG